MDKNIHDSPLKTLLNSPSPRPPNPNLTTLPSPSSSIVIKVFFLF